MIADMVEGILVHSYQIPDLLHYLDDFMTMGPPESSQCAHNISTIIAVCKCLGLPLHPGKCVGPSTVLVVLGIVACLPTEKLLAFKELITLWLTQKWYNRQDLESPMGHLHQAAKVVWPGTTSYAA